MECIAYQTTSYHLTYLKILFDSYKDCNEQDSQESCTYLCKIYRTILLLYTDISPTAKEDISH